MLKWLPFVALATACGSDSNDYTVDDIESSLVSGSIGGASWEMVEAIAEVDAFDDTQISFSVYGEDVEDCGFAIDPTGPFLLFSLPAESGEYPLSFSLTEGGTTLTMVEPPSTNTIVSEGLIDLTIDGDQIDVGLVARVDDANEVNGSFSTTLCGGESE